MTPPESCIDLEVLTSFTEGSLDQRGIGDVTRHLSGCAPCRLTVERIVKFKEEDEERESSSASLAVAASVIVAVIAASLLLYYGRKRELQDPIGMMAKAAPRAERTIEPYLSGGYRWAPFHNVMAGSPEPSPEALRARGAAAKILSDLGKDRSAAALHAKGVASLLRGDTASAVTQLRDSTRLGAGDAGTWNDLAAALYVSAQTDAEMREALAAAREAIRLDAGSNEAYFNVALVQERIGTKSEIRAAWIDYLRHQPAPGWAEEAKKRLARDEDGK